MIPKFRAWDKKLKKMFEVSFIDFDTKLVGLNIDLEIIIFDFEDIILMQSTGLKDKNGKEVFEGDILAFETDKGILNVNIYWDSKHALFMFKSEKYKEEELLAELVENNTYPFEIAGNIYENPELLEEEE